MAKEWPARNARETWNDHNLEEGLEFTWSDGTQAKVVKHMREPRIYKVEVKGFERITTEPYILRCMAAAGEDPQIDLYYSAWPFRGDVRRGQKIVVIGVAIAFLVGVSASVITLMLVAH